MPVAYINIGSNMGDRLVLIEQAVAHIEHLCGTSARRAPLFHSQPWGYESDAEFLNLGIAIETEIAPVELLNALQAIERKISAGRHRDDAGNYIDREIDIDIIAIDELVVHTPKLTLPHPRMHIRNFVLEPLSFIAPEWKHPGLGLTPVQLMNKKWNNGGVIVGIGEVLWDMFPEGKKIGGAPANFAYHVLRQGFQSVVVSSLGNDDLGQEIEIAFKEVGLNYLLEKIDYPTGTVQVSLDAVGVPQYEITEDVAWDNISLNEKLLWLAQATSVVCFGTLAQRNAKSRHTISSFIDAMPHDALKVFDINLRQNFYSREIIHESLKKCNVLKINDEELSVVGEIFALRGDFNAQCCELMTRYQLKILILTCGINGSYVFSRNEMSFIETPKVEVVDTVGAGDAFTAVFIASILKGDEIKEAHQRAVDISAYVCTQEGAMPHYVSLLK